MSDIKKQNVYAKPMADVLEEFLRTTAAEDIELHSMLLVQADQVLAEAYRAPYGPDTAHRLYSVTKSFTSTAIGLAVSEGLLTVDDPVASFFPERLPYPVSQNLAGLCIRHLLTMTAEHPPLVGTFLSRPAPSVAGFLGESMSVEPGSRFEYSNGCSYMLSAIIQRVSGQTLHEYLRDRIFDPLAITANHWLKSPEGVCNGGTGLHMTTREMARFGQLYLKHGVYEGQNLVDAGWIASATRGQVQSWGPALMPDWQQGYCYQFWRGRHGTYRADGLLGQFCIVIEDLDAVVVTTAGTAKTQRLLDLIWQKILPILENRPASDADVPIFVEDARAPLNMAQAARVSGTRFALGQPFVLPSRFYGEQVPLIAVQLEVDGPELSLGIETECGDYRLGVGTSDWSEGITPLSTGFPEPYRARAHSDETGRVAIELTFVEGGFSLHFAFNAEFPQLDIRLPEYPGLDGRTILCRPGGK